MRSTGALESLQALLVADPDVVDREELGVLIRHARAVRGYLDAAEVRFSRRSRQLAQAGQSESPMAVLMDEGRRSGKEAKAAQDRDRVCEQFAGFEEALLVHEGGWQLAMTADRITTWTRPDGSIWWTGASNDRTRRPRARPPDRLLV